MSDARLRELETRWRTTNDPEDEVRYLGERIRLGLLPRPRLILAAYVGSPGAQRILGDKGFPEERNLVTWVRGLGTHRRLQLVAGDLTREACVRAGLAAARLASTSGTFQASDQQLAAVLAYVLCPCSAHQEALAELGIEWPSSMGRSGVALEDMLLASVANAEATAIVATQMVKAAAKALPRSERHRNKAVRRVVERELLAWLFS